MATNDFQFITRWRVPATLSDVNQVIGTATDLPRWWPSVYLDVLELERGESSGLGKVVSLYTKGWLPYTLRWQFQVTDVRTPYGFTLEAWGDLTGRGIWTFEPDGEFVNITYDWKVRGDKPLFRYFSFVLKPLFSANHHWAMRMGEISLHRELARRRATSGTERALVPPPPGPTFAALVQRGRAWPTIRSSARA